MQRKLITYGLVDIISLGMTRAASAHTFNLRFAHHISKSPFLDVEEAFIKPVEMRTGGKVKIAITYSGGLGGGNEMLGLVGRTASSLSYLRRN